MKKLSPVLIALGSFSVVLAITIFIAIFYSVISVEVGYQINQVSGQSGVKKEIIPLDKDFGVVIPKISANSKVILNVDPFNEKVYQVALTRGVAHAKGTTVPGKEGNVFLFSHSSVNFYEANRYNSIFYLLDKLVVGDKIDLYYSGEKFKYFVTDKKIVNAQDIKYLGSLGSGKTITLMTCWPPGTTWKRLIVIAKMADF